MTKPSIAILASGSGTTAEALIYATQNGTLDADVKLVITNNPDAEILQKIERFNASGLAIETRIINGTTHPGQAERGEQTPAEAQAIYDTVKSSSIDVVLLLGYMRKVVAPLLNMTILNTHPGLLPATRGLYGRGVQEFVIKQSFKETGQTLHEVVAEYDSGRIIAEHILPVMSWDTVDTLSSAVQLMEKAYIATDVNHFLKTYEARNI